MSAMSAALASATAHEAKDLGHHWMGAEHVLLAVTASPPDFRATRALSSLGVTHDRATAALRERIAREGPPVPHQYSGILSSPSFHDAAAAATSVGLAAGHAEPNSEDALLGLLTLPPDSPADVLLADMGTTRDAVVAALEAEGVPAKGLRDRPAENPLLELAERQAITRGYPYVAESDMMLAILAGGPDALARDALAAVGVTYERYLAWDDERRGEQYPPTRPSPSGVTAAHPNPAVRNLLGRAQGFAWSLGDGVVRSEHGFLGWLWDPWGFSILDLEHLSTTAVAALAALSAAGVRTPSGPLPEPDREPWGERIEVPRDRLMHIVDELQKENLPFRSWGFNHYQGIAWVRSWARIDLRPIVARVLERQD